jgi:hypothetical protein
VVSFLPQTIEYYDMQGGMQVWERGKAIPVSA